MGYQVLGLGRAVVAASPGERLAALLQRIVGPTNDGRADGGIWSLMDIDRPEKEPEEKRDRPFVDRSKREEPQSCRQEERGGRGGIGVKRSRGLGMVRLVIHAQRQTPPCQPLGGTGFCEQVRTGEDHGSSYQRIHEWVSCRGLPPRETMEPLCWRETMVRCQGSQDAVDRLGERCYA